MTPINAREMLDQLHGRSPRSVPDDERRQRDVARWPDRRAHAFWSPWPTATMTKCERCGVRYGEHAR